MKDVAALSRIKRLLSPDEMNSGRQPGRTARADDAHEGSSWLSDDPQTLQECFNPSTLLLESFRTPVAWPGLRVIE